MLTWGRMPHQERFLRQLRYSAEERRRSLGKRCASIMADAARDGALENSRLVFLLLENFEDQWRALVDETVEDLRRFSGKPGRRRKRLANVARGHLEEVWPSFVAAAKLERPAGAFPARVLTGESKDRVDTLSTYATMKFEQFTARVGEPPGSLRGFLGRVMEGTLVRILTGSLAALLLFFLGWLAGGGGQ